MGDRCVIVEAVTDTSREDDSEVKVSLRIRFVGVGCADEPTTAEVPFVDEGSVPAVRRRVFVGRLLVVLSGEPECVPAETGFEAGVEMQIGGIRVAPREFDTDV